MSYILLSVQFKIKSLFLLQSRHLFSQLSCLHHCGLPLNHALPEAVRLQQTLSIPP